MAQSVINALSQFATASATQGSADAFATTRIETGISTAARYGWMIDTVEFYLDVAASGWANADCSAQFQLLQGTVPTAVLAPTSADFICEARYAKMADGTPASTQTIPLTSQWKAPENFVIVDPAIHLAIDSTSTNVANTVVVRIFYWPVELSEMDLLRMLSVR